jgi:hypothetical protein
MRMLDDDLENARRHHEHALAAAAARQEEMVMAAAAAATAQQQQQRQQRQQQQLEEAKAEWAEAAEKKASSRHTADTVAQLRLATTWQQELSAAQSAVADERKARLASEAALAAAAQELESLKGDQEVKLESLKGDQEMKHSEQTTWGVFFFFFIF